MDKRIAASKFREWFEKEGFDEDSPVRTVALYAFLQGVELASGVNNINVGDTVVMYVRNLIGGAVYDAKGNIVNKKGDGEMCGVVTKIVQREDKDRNKVFTVKVGTGSHKRKVKYCCNEHSESGWIRKFGEIN